jgi:hypothetical protein
VTLLATPDDVAAVWRTIQPGEEARRVDHLLAVATARVRQRFAGIDDRIASGDLDEVLVTHVVATLVKRAMTARAGDQPTSEGIGEASRSWTPGGSGDDALVVDDDLAALLQPVPAGTGRPGTAALGVGLPLP